MSYWRSPTIMAALRDLGRVGEHAQARSIAAWLCRRYTTAKLSALSRVLGYARPECIPGIVRRVETWRERDARIQGTLLDLERRLDEAGADPFTISEMRGWCKWLIRETYSYMSDPVPLTVPPGPSRTRSLPSDPVPPVPPDPVPP